MLTDIPSIGVFPSEMTTGKSDEAQKSDLGDMHMSNSAGTITLLEPLLDLALPSTNVGVVGTGRPGYDSDMAACILYLASPGGVFLNGQIIYLDGGRSLSFSYTC